MRDVEVKLPTVAFPVSDTPYVRAVYVWRKKVTSRGRGFGEGRVVALGEGAILSNMPLPALSPHHHSMRPRGSTSSCTPSSSFLFYSFWIVGPCLCLYVTAKTSILQCGHFVHNTPSPHSPSRPCTSVVMYRQPNPMHSFSTHLTCTPLAVSPLRYRSLLSLFPS